jgi:hypothetical protein
MGGIDHGYTEVGTWCRGVKRLHGGAELYGGVDKNASAGASSNIFSDM